MTKLQEHGGKWTITIPALMIKDKGWKKGQELILMYDSAGNILIREVKV